MIPSPGESQQRTAPVAPHRRALPPSSLGPPAFRELRVVTFHLHLLALVSVPLLVQTVIFGVEPPRPPVSDTDGDVRSKVAFVSLHPSGFSVLTCPRQPVRPSPRPAFTRIIWPTSTIPQRDDLYLSREVRLTIQPVVYPRGQQPFQMGLSALPLVFGSTPLAFKWSNTFQQQFYIDHLSSFCCLLGHHSPNGDLLLSPEADGSGAQSRFWWSPWTLLILTISPSRKYTEKTRRNQQGRQAWK